MENWEKATNKFLDKWKDKKEVVGAIVCGSYVTGNPSKQSDIDLHIILDDKSNWRMRGNEYVNGFLIEYFINPAKQHEKYFTEDINEKTKNNIHMFLTGKVLFDKNGDLKKIIESAKKWDKKKYPKINPIINEINKYFLWDMNDNLNEIYDKNESDFYFVYYNFLNQILIKYSNYLSFDNIPANRVKSFLTEKESRVKYRLDDYPDKKFVKKYIDCMTLRDTKIMMEKYSDLTLYVQKIMGGFQIDGWKIKVNRYKKIVNN